MTGRISRRRLLLAASTGGVAVAGGYVSVTTAPAAVASAEPPNDAAVGFCTDMTAHHLQAMAMCQRVLGRDTGDAVQAAASEVLQTQSIEVGMMRAWLTDWGESTSAPETVMAWMGPTFFCTLETMPGYASEAELHDLSLAEGTEKGRMWLELMRAHHVGGVLMASAATDLVDVEKVQRLAETQAAVQSYEIEQYDLLLASDYA